MSLANVKYLNLNNSQITNISSKNNKNFNENTILTQKGVEETIKQKCGGFLQRHNQNMLYDSTNFNDNIYGYDVELNEEEKTFSYIDFSKCNNKIYLSNIINKNDIEYVNVSNENKVSGETLNYNNETEIKIIPEALSYTVFRDTVRLTEIEPSRLYTIPKGYFKNIGYTDNTNNYQYIFCDKEHTQNVELKTSIFGSIRHTLSPKMGVEFSEKIKELMKSELCLYNYTDHLRDTDFQETENGKYTFASSQNVQTRYCGVVVSNFINAYIKFLPYLNLVDTETFEWYEFPAQQNLYIYSDTRRTNFEFSFIRPRDRLDSEYGWGYDTYHNLKYPIYKSYISGNIVDLPYYVENVKVSPKIENLIIKLNLENKSPKENIIELYNFNSDNYIINQTANTNLILIIKGNYRNSIFTTIPLHCVDLVLDEDFFDGVAIDSQTSTLIDLSHVVIEHSLKINAKFLNTTLTGDALIQKLSSILNYNGNIILF